MPLHRDTKLAHSFARNCPSTGAVVPPIHVGTSYVRDDNYEKTHGRTYIRDDNPNYDTPEALLADLEGAQDCMLYPSGSAAYTHLFQCLPARARVVAQRQIYFGMAQWLENQQKLQRLNVAFVDTGNMEQLAAALDLETALVWIETPANPQLMVTDIAKAAELAHACGAKLAVDSTVATPILSQPIAFGADFVCHSATKSLNGHSDVLAGAMLCAQDDDFWQYMRTDRHLAGLMLGSFEAHQLLRGMKTLHLRVARACENAQRVAQYLETHANVEVVNYPGLPSNAGHEIAKAQMSGGFGSLMSFCYKGSSDDCKAMLVKLKLIKCATSLGNTESLIEHRVTVEGSSIGTPDNLLRLSIGIENVDDIIADLDAVL